MDQSKFLPMFKSKAKQLVNQLKAKFLLMFLPSLKTMDGGLKMTTYKEGCVSKPSSATGLRK
jgi:hypothetical protein